MRAWLCVIALVGCSKPSPNCERAVKHSFALMAAPAGFKPSADEQRAIDGIEKATLERCDSEGLSDAQRDCILAATSFTDRTFLMCPALVAKKPSWINAPIGHPEVLHAIKDVAEPPVTPSP